MRGSIDSGLSPEQLHIVRTAQQFADKEIEPYAAKWDEEHVFPLEMFQRAGELGFGGIYVKEDLGSGLSRLDASLILEQLSMACPASAAFISIHNMVCGMIDQFGTPEQRQRLLPELVPMERMASYCLTEPSSGSDSSALKTSAKRDGDFLVINGEKAFISGAGSSSWYAVMVRTGDNGPKGITCVLIPSDAPGISFGQNERKLGWRCQPTRLVTFSNCRVPIENVLGGFGNGFGIAMKGLDGGRVNIATCSLGAAQRCFDIAQQYVQDRVAFGKPLSALQDIQFKLADMATAVHSSRLIIRHAARALDESDPNLSMYCSMAKLHATEECYKVVDKALQMHGGYGYLQDYKVERYLRDLRVHRILEGANEVMKLIIGRSVLKK
eukprot:TRINITY_DN93510_c0_g1_i1.p1 TRINITY_DN93510_c0_g1~~TRINITY_DN93510_c0_g1_i1.p1  ORF type:complete len:413 (-),score=82.80 TRINITY_DN93510_c0_g1_i1:27-1175(-)